MTEPEATDAADDPLSVRIVRVSVSIVVLVPVTVFLGYGGWFLLTLASAVAGYDPETEDEEPLRERLFAWPDRNREVMRTDGRTELPLRP